MDDDLGNNSEKPCCCNASGDLNALRFVWRSCCSRETKALFTYCVLFPDEAKKLHLPFDLSLDR